MWSNCQGFKKIVTVKYNHNSPSEYVINPDWNDLLIAGIIIVLVVSIIFVSIKISIKKLYDKANNTKKDNF